MRNFQNIIDGYDKTAHTYAEKFSHELDQKPLERQLLQDFLAANQAKGAIVDLGCGPGHIAHYLQTLGATDLLGIDLSSVMVELARERHPSIPFEVGNILALPYPDHHFGAALALYSLIYFDEVELQQALVEIKRVLRPGGDLLFSFHLGRECLHVGEFLGETVDIDCYFYDVEQLRSLVEASGLSLVQLIERAPIEGIEYPSRRGYFWVRREE